MKNKSKILIPRRIEERKKRYGLIINKQIQDYIKGGCVGDLNLSQSPITKLPDNLIKVGGNLNLSLSKIEDLNNLEYVEGSLFLFHCKNLYKLPKSLNYVGGNLDAFNANIKKISKKIKVFGYIDCRRTDWKLIESLRYIAWG